MKNNRQQKINLERSILGPPPSKIKEFDFLIGDWKATTKSYAPNRTVQSEGEGKLHAHYVNGGRMIFDDFTRLTQDGEEVSYAATLRTFCEATDEWVMSFIFSLRQEHTESFRGKFVDGEGHFNAILSLTPENSIMAKVRFFDIDKNSFEWSMETSADNGKSWTLTERISAKRI